MASISSSNDHKCLKLKTNDKLHSKLNPDDDGSDINDGAEKSGEEEEGNNENNDGNDEEEEGGEVDDRKLISSDNKFASKEKLSFEQFAGQKEDEHVEKPSVKLFSKSKGKVKAKKNLFPVL